MSKNSLIVMLAVAIAVSACATSARHQAEKAAPPAPVVAVPAPMPDYRARMPVEAGGGIPHETEFQPLIPARAFCTREKICGQNYGAYGYIVFTRRPASVAEKQRYLSICRAYLANLEEADNYAHIARSQIATTFWLLASRPQHENSCDELVDRYDYARATQIAASIRKLRSAGPILVASGQPEVVQTETQELMIIDMGKMRNADMNRAFAIWKDKISQDRRFWGSSFNLDLIVTEFGRFIRTYGASIVQIIKPG